MLRTVPYFPKLLQSEKFVLFLLRILEYFEKANTKNIVINPFPLTEISSGKLVILLIYPSLISHSGIIASVLFR